jgi:hypothetical protein
MKTLRLLGCMAVVTIPLMTADLGFAQLSISQDTAAASANKVKPPKPGPAPLIGVGLPAVGGALLALLLVRRFRQKH